MGRNWLKLAIVGAGFVVLAAPAAQTAEVADAVRGGWIAEVEGTRHVFVLVVRGTAVTGIHCALDCRDPSRLAFVEGGELTADGVKFRIRAPDGTLGRGEVVGRVVDERLLLELASDAGAGLPRKMTLQRDPRKPKARTVEELFASRGVQSGPLVIAGSSTPYVPPGPNEMLDAATLEGLWVWSNGPGKQHFIFRRVGDGLKGVACGPCDNPWTFGPIENVVIRGDTLTFDIVHEDWGIGIEHGPYSNHATATLSHHEMHLRTVQQNGPRIIHGDLVLAGPIRIATH